MHDHSSHAHRHDHHHGHHHDGHDHHHDHAHPNSRHNGPPADHLHSHAHGDSGRAMEEELQVLCASFIDGFRTAADKNSYLRIAGIPFSRKGEDGLTQHLVDSVINSNWQIGTASPAFASRELAYMPYPGEMISMRETMIFTYVSLTSRADIALRDILHEQVQHG